MIQLKKLGVIIIIVIVVSLMILSGQENEEGFIKIKDKNFHLISNPDNKDVEEDLMQFAKKNKIKLTIDYADDLEVVDMLESGNKDYDALWLSNSVWVYMLNNVRVSDSKSININPVVFGIKKSKAESLGFTKEDIRILSKHFGLPTWEKQSFACLASRFVYGETITKEKLSMVDKAEQLLLDLGFHQMRVRIHGTMARIEVMPNEFEKLISDEVRNKIITSFKSFGFTYISMDLIGYRTGSMNEVIK